MQTHLTFIYEMSSTHPMPQEELNGRDLAYLLHAIDLSHQSRQDGKHPFGAVVVDSDGIIVAEAGNNSLPPDGDPTQHAELIAASMAARRRTPQQLLQSTLYTSAEPCAMCAGAVYWCNIGRVVYGLSETSLLELTGNHPVNSTFTLPCREVFAHGQRQIEVIGPALEDDAAEAHAGFWHKGQD